MPASDPRGRRRVAPPRADRPGDVREGLVVRIIAGSGDCEVRLGGLTGWETGESAPPVAVLRFRGDHEDSSALNSPGRCRPRRSPAGQRAPAWPAGSCGRAGARTRSLGVHAWSRPGGVHDRHRAAAERIDRRAVATPTLEAERDVTVAGRHFKARCAGSGPSVVMLADYGRAMDEVWGTIPETLATSSRVCVYDRLGVGRSDPAPDRQTFASIADDLDGVITAVGTDPARRRHGPRRGRPDRAVVGEPARGRRARGRPVRPGAARLPRAARGPVEAVAAQRPGRPGAEQPLGRHRQGQRPGDEQGEPRSGVVGGLRSLPAMSTPLYDLVDAQVQSWPAAVDAKKVDAAWRQYQRRVLAMSSPSEMIAVAKPDDWPAMIKSTLERALRS